MSSPAPLPNGGDVDRGGGILATAVIVSVIACTAVALRLGTRIWIVRSVGWDDYTILCAAFGEIISIGLVIVQVHYGMGRHRYYLTKWQYIEAQKYSYGEWIQTFQTLMFTKISICFFLLRIPVEKHLIRPIQAAIVALVVSNIVLTLLWIFQCNPIASAWNKDTPGKCFTDAQLQRIIISQALISIISDFLLAGFPVLLLWRVQIAIRTKIGLWILMGLGLMYALSLFYNRLKGSKLTIPNSTAACCIVRTILNWQNINADPTWESIYNWYWRASEVCVGITAACIPALRPGYRTLTASISSYLSRRSARKTTDVALVKTGDPSHDLADQKSKAHSAHAHTAHSKFLHGPALGAAAQTATAEADRARRYGAGDAGFAMNSLPGDKKTVNQGIKKVTRIDVDLSRANGSQKSLGLGDLERGFGNREFI